MRFALPVICMVMLSCNGTTTQKAETPQTKDTIHFPIAPRHTTDFKIGNAGFTKMILEFTRAFDRGDIIHLKENFAQQLTVMLQDQYLQGERDSVLQQLQERRNKYTYVNTIVESWVPLHAMDTKENFVLVWGKRISTLPDKKILNRTIMEKWRINGQGQIDFIQQYINESFDSTE
jgi:hypothetical protein